MHVISFKYWSWNIDFWKSEFSPKRISYHSILCERVPLKEHDELSTNQTLIPRHAFNVPYECLKMFLRQSHVLRKVFVIHQPSWEYILYLKLRTIIFVGDIIWPQY